MANQYFSSTLSAQKLYGDPEAWRAAPVKVFTSSQIAGVTIPQLQRQEQAELAEAQFTFDDETSNDFFSNALGALNDLIDTLDNGDVEAQISTVDNALFDYSASLDLFKQSLEASRSSLNIEDYNEAITLFNDVKDLTEESKRATGQNLRRVVDGVFQSIDGIANIDGAAGRKVANNILSVFLSDTAGSQVDRVTAISSLAANFFPEASLGKRLLDQAEPIIGAAQSLLKTATETFDGNTSEAKTSITTQLTPLFESINDLTRFLPNRISDEVSRITQQTLGITERIDKGLSAIASDNRQVQPLAGKYTTDTGVRISSQLFRPTPTFDFAASDVFSGDPSEFGDGAASSVPSISGYNDRPHPRRTGARSNIIGDGTTVVVPELSDLRFSILNALRKYPADALINPELANGPSLTSAEIEGVIPQIIGNERFGSTVADLTGVLKSSEQAFIPRIG